MSRAGMKKLGGVTMALACCGLLATPADDAVVSAHRNLPGGRKVTARDALAVVVVAEQRMVVSAGGATYSFKVSTGVAGVGSEANSGKTPKGWHKVNSRFGAKAATGQLFVSRRPVEGKVRSGKELLSANGEEVLSRIFWLEGLEPGVNKDPKGNYDSYLRHIYIHGTNQEQLLGKPASHGCIRMGNADVVRLFDIVRPCKNFYVYIDG